MGLFTDLFSFIAPKNSGRKEIVNFPGDSSYETDIVGEVNYQDALEDLCGSFLPKGVYQFETARLVGHLSLEDTIRYRRYLNAKGVPNAYGQCQAVIKGGWISSDGRHGPFYVALDLPVLVP